MASTQITELSDEDSIRLGPAIGALISFGAASGEGAIAGAQAGAERAAHKDFGLTRNQINDIAKNIPNNTAAGLLLIEDLWAKKFKEIAMKKNGIVLVNGFNTPLALVELGAELAQGAVIAEKAHNYYELRGGPCG